MANRVEIRIGGSGGQGIVLASQILGKAAILDGRHALQTQAYGAEARGSLAKGEVVISDARIGFPAVRASDILVAMNQESLDSLLTGLKETGTLLVDGSNVSAIPTTKAEVWKMPITETARRAFGETMFANMVMLGVLTRISRVVSEKSMEEAIKATVPQKTCAANVDAYRKGLELLAS